MSDETTQGSNEVESNRDTKGVYAESAAEAAQRGRKLGLTGDIEVSPTDGVTKDNGKIRAWEVTGEQRNEDSDSD